MLFKTRMFIAKRTCDKFEGRYINEIPEWFINRIVEMRKLGFALGIQ